MTIRNALAKTFGRSYNNFKGEVGLEIETESRTDYKIPEFSFWVLHNDGSLRDIGREFVLRQPLMVDKELPEALKEFDDKTKGIKFVENSITTSTHVHLNMLNETFLTLGNFLTVYTLVENLLIRFSGEDRKSNLFCLPMCDAEEIFYSILKMVQGIGNKKYQSLSFSPDNVKYGAINLASLVGIGSLEVRSFRGTTDTKLIEKWVRILYCILQYARQDKLLPPQIILQFKEKGAELLSEIFGEFREDIRHKEEDKLLEKNFWYAASIAYSIKNWDKLEEVAKPKKGKSKDIEKLAQAMFERRFEDLNFEQQQQVIRRSGEELNQAAEGSITPTRWEDFRPTGIPTRDTLTRAVQRDTTPTWVVDLRNRIDNDEDLTEVEWAALDEYNAEFEIRNNPR